MSCKILSKNFYKDMTFASVPLDIAPLRIGDKVNDGAGTVISSKIAEPLEGVCRAILVIKGRIDGDELIY